MYAFHKPAASIPLDKPMKLGEGHYLLKRDTQLIYEVTDFGTPQAHFIKKLSFKLSESISSPRLTCSEGSVPNAPFSEPACYQFLMEKEEIALFTVAIEQPLQQENKSVIHPI